MFQYNSYILKKDCDLIKLIIKSAQEQIKKPKKKGFFIIVTISLHFEIHYLLDLEHILQLVR
jgi:phosphoglycerol transferase MdoB-like AlkP superfamily enzyme